MAAADNYPSMDDRTRALSDADLTADVATGDREAFAELYSRHATRVFRFARLMTGSTPLSEDVVQDVFLALMCQAHQFDPGRGTLTTYLFSIARYHVRRHLFRQRRMVPLEAAGLLGSADVDVAATPFDETLRRELAAKTRQAVLTLPSRYREVVVLCDIQGVSYADAAAALGCALGTVRSRLSRGRQLLADKLQRPAAVRGRATPFVSSSVRCVV